MQHRYDQALLAMTANRMCDPKSKLGAWDRWLEKVYLPGCNGLNYSRYEAMDFLHAHIAEVEESVFFQTANLFNLSVDLIFYSPLLRRLPSNYEDDADEISPGFRQYGYTKEVFWAPQVMIALAATREGLPVKSWIFPGNTEDVTTIEHIKKDLRSWLATRMATVAEIKNEVLSRPGRYTAIIDNLQAKEVVIGDGERRRRYILCYNPTEGEQQRQHREEIVRKEVLSLHRDHSASAAWAIDLLASKRFKRYLTTKADKLRLDRAAIKEASRDDTISLEDAALGYKSLLIIERCFRSLKRTQIKMMRCIIGFRVASKRM